MKGFQDTLCKKIRRMPSDNTLPNVNHKGAQTVNASVRSFVCVVVIWNTWNQSHCQSKPWGG